MCTSKLSVTVANGQKMERNSKCTNFTWIMGGYEFYFDPKLLKLCGYDMVLGVDFLHRYGPAKFDYETRKVTMKPKFIRSKIKIVIQENQRDGVLEMITGKAVNKMFKKHKFRVGCFFMMTGVTEDQEILAPHDEMKELLSEFSDVFAEPTELPPQ